MLFPTNHLKIIDFIRKIIEIAVIFRVQATWSPMAKNLLFWRLRGGSGRFQVALGEPRRLRGGSRRLRGGSRRLPGRSWRLQERPEGGEPLGGVWGSGSQTPPF